MALPTYDNIALIKSNLRLDATVGVLVEAMNVSLVKTPGFETKLHLRIKLHNFTNWMKLNVVLIAVLHYRKLTKISAEMQWVIAFPQQIVASVNEI